MLQRLSLIVGAFVLLGVFIAPSNAHAEVSIAVVDIDKILTESVVATSLQKQVQSERDKLQAEFAGYEQSLRDNEQELIKERPNMTPEEFEKKRDEFQKELQETGSIVQVKKRKLEKAMVVATSRLRNEILKIVAAMAETQKFDVVLSKQNIVLVAKSLDMTDDVMEKINANVQNIPLEIE